MSKSLCLFLTDETDIRKVCNGFNRFIQIRFCGISRKICFKLKGMVKVILNCALATVGDDKNILNSGGNCLLNYILNSRLVNDIEHLLGNRF